MWKEFLIEMNVLSKQNKSKTYVNLSTKIYKWPGIYYFTLEKVNIHNNCQHISHICNSIQPTDHPFHIHKYALKPSESRHTIM